PCESPRQLHRLDIKNRLPTPPAAVDGIVEVLRSQWDAFDALIVLDQVGEADCGVVTARVREELARLADRDPAAFVLADSRERIGLFRNVALKPNLTEALRALGVSDAVATAARRAHCA